MMGMADSGSNGGQVHFARVLTSWDQKGNCILIASDNADLIRGLHAERRRVVR